jgi:hypothetical protein
MHPLTPDLSSLSDAELSKKHNELSTKLMQAYRFGNGSLVYQLQMVIEDYTMELGRRQQKLMDELTKNNKEFNNIIDIQ